MARFFEGRVDRGTVRVECEGGRVFLRCSVTEYWDEINTTVGACGLQSAYEVTKRVGLSQAHVHKLESTIESSLGVEAIAQLKSSITASIEVEARWELETEEKQTFTFTAPPCGRQLNTVYQLVREYEILRVTLKGFLRRQREWQLRISERLPVFYVQPNVEPWIPECRCRAPQPREYGGAGDLDLGSVAVQVPYWGSNGGVEVDLREARLEPGTSKDKYMLEAPTSSLPPVVPWLGDLRDGIVRGELSLAWEDEALEREEPQAFGRPLRIRLKREGGEVRAGGEEALAGEES